MCIYDEKSGVSLPNFRKIWAIMATAIIVVALITTALCYNHFAYALKSNNSKTLNNDTNSTMYICPPNFTYTWGPENQSIVNGTLKMDIWLTSNQSSTFVKINLDKISSNVCNEPIVKYKCNYSESLQDMFLFHNSDNEIGAFNTQWVLDGVGLAFINGSNPQDYKAYLFEMDYIPSISGITGGFEAEPGILEPDGSIVSNSNIISLPWEVGPQKIFLNCSLVQMANGFAIDATGLTFVIPLTGTENVASYVRQGNILHVYLKGPGTVFTRFPL
jgi:hypothetical protein